MRQVAFDFLGLHLGIVGGDIGGVADVRPGVEPVVGADGNGHQAEGGEGPHHGQQSLNPSVTPRHGASYHGAHHPPAAFSLFFYFTRAANEDEAAPDAKLEETHAPVCHQTQREDAFLSFLPLHLPLSFSLFL